MVREDLVTRKLAHLRSYLDELEPHARVDLDSYVRDGGPRRAIERLIQLVIESAVDINVHLVTEIEGAPPPDYRSSFFAAARCGVISSGLAERLAPSAGLRNALTHDYADIEDARVLESVSLVLGGFGEYAAAVHVWLRGRAGQ